MSLPQIDHPLVDLVIPSTKQKTKCRPMLVKEEKILLMAKQSDVPTDIFNAIYQIVNNCIVDKKTNIEKLALFDIEYLYLKIRAFSVNNIARQRYIDNDDQNEYEFEVDLDKVEMKYPENVDKNIKVNDKITIIMKYPPSSLYSDKKILANQDTIDTTLMISCIDKICEGDKMHDVKDSEKDQFEEFIDNLPIHVSNKIKEFVNNLPTLYHEIKYTNKKGDERVIKLASVIDFFIF